MYKHTVLVLFLLTASSLSQISGMEIKSSQFEKENPEKKRLVHNLWVIQQYTQNTFGDTFPKDLRILINTFTNLTRAPLKIVFPTPQILESILANINWETKVYKKYQTWYPNRGESIVKKHKIEFIEGKIHFIKDGVDYKAEPTFRKSQFTPSTTFRAIILKAQNKGTNNFFDISEMNNFLDEREGRLSAIYSYLPLSKMDMEFTPTDSVRLTATPLNDFGSPLDIPKYILTQKEGTQGKIHSHHKQNCLEPFPITETFFTTIYKLPDDKKEGDISPDDVIITVSELP